MVGHALTASTIANVNRPKGHKGYTVEDFMPHTEQKAQTEEEMLQFAETLTMGLGGQDLRDKGEAE